MAWSVVIIEAIIFIALFSAMVIFSTIKNPEAGAHNYPLEIQEEYFKNHKREEAVPSAKKAAAQKLVTIIFFAAVLTLGAVIAGAESFWDGFVFGFLLLAAEGVWDTFFIDWVLFAKWKIFRLPGTEHMDKEYAQKWFHVKGMIFPGLLYAAAVGAVTGLGTILIK